MSQLAPVLPHCLLSLQRIRTPLTPEILKSSMSWTMVSLLGSLGSLSRTWSKSQGATDGSNLPLASCSPGGSSGVGAPLPLQLGPAGRKAAGPPCPLLGSSHSAEPAGACPSGSPAPRPPTPARGAPAGLAPTLPGPGRLLGRWERVGEAPHTFQELDLIHSCLRVMPCALHHFEGHEALAPATPRPVSAASTGQTHGAIAVASTVPEGRTPAGVGPRGVEGALTGCPSRARRWRSGPSPACAPRGTAH